ncbi:MAG: PP0621 family protein [Methylophilaceae bacterium]
MPRVILLIILFWLLYQVLKRLADNTNQAASSQKTKASEKIVQCTQCGLRVPENESHLHDGAVICNNPQCSVPTQK